MKIKNVLQAWRHGLKSKIEAYKDVLDLER